MKERPILFSAPMVRALLDGSKTQTRRVVKGFSLELLQPDNFTPEYVALPENGFCPHGQAGDRLWVRETWAEVGTMDPGLNIYRANYPECVPCGYENVPAADKISWKPSIHMHRHRSRINLEITGLRIERLQNISEADAQAEGVERRVVGEGWREYGLDAETEACGTPPLMSAKESFTSLWKSINGAKSWELNPWVWVIEFKVMKL